MRWLCCSVSATPPPSLSRANIVHGSRQLLEEGDVLSGGIFEGIGQELHPIGHSNLAVSSPKMVVSYPVPHHRRMGKGNTLGALGTVL